MKSYVYVITCLINGKRYLGKTNNPEKRWAAHCKSGPARRLCGMLIHHAICKHGTENFKFDVVVECSSEDEAFEAEHKLIVELGTSDLNVGYNMNEGGRGGRNPSEQVREKIGLKHRGKQISDQQKAMISKRHKGKVVSEETRKLLSKIRSGSGNSRWGQTWTWSEKTRERITTTKLRNRLLRRLRERLNTTCDVKGI